MFKNILLACAMALASLATYASPLPDYPFIHAKGSAYVFAMPDMGEIDFDIRAEDAAPDAATAAVEARITEIQGRMAEQGLNADDVDVHSLQKTMAKSAQGDGNADTYSVKCSAHIVVRDLSKWREIMLLLLNMPNIDSLEANFSTTARAKLVQELMNNAFKDAQGNAEAMAAGFGKHAGAVTAISSGELKNVSTAVGLVPGDFYYTRMKEAEESHKPGDPNALLSITALKMFQSVDVVFRIK